MRIISIMPFIFIFLFHGSVRSWTQGKYVFNITHSNSLQNRNSGFCLQCSFPLLQAEDLGEKVN